MHPTFPCPNPICTHTFSPDAVKGVSSLKCPKCGTVFQFGPRQSAPARPSAAPPKAAPVVPRAPALVPPPLAVPVEAVQTPTGLDFHSASEMVVPRLRSRAEKGRKKRLAPLLAVLVVVGLGIAGVVWGGMWLLHWNKSENANEDPVRGVSQANNFRFSQPGQPWRRETNIEFKLHVNLGMSSTDRNNNMGLCIKDYKTRVPSDAEMTDEALGKLRAYFQGVEWELKPRDDEITLGGQPALSLAFVGEDAEHVSVSGECYMVAFRGVAYWFFTWGATEDKELLSPEWEGLRARLAILDGRKGWTQKPPETEKAQGKKAKYQLTYVKGLWTRRNSPEDYDPLADLVLQGDEPDPSHKTLSSTRATFQILVLPKQANLKAAAAAALDYVKKRPEEAVYPKTTWELIKDKKGAVIDRNTDIGDELGHLSKLDVRNTDDLRRFMVLAVMNRPQGTLVLVGDCLWERRDFWEQEFAPLLKSLKVR